MKSPPRRDVSVNWNRDVQAEESGYGCLSVVGTLLSGVGGGVLRLLPEALKFLDTKNERAHGLALQDRQIEMLKLQQSGKLQEMAAQGRAQLDLEQLRRPWHCGLCPVLATRSNALEAVSDFVFSLGAGRLQASTLCRRINNKKWALAAKEFGKWVFAGGRKLPGLVLRREGERALFLLE